MSFQPVGNFGPETPILTGGVVIFYSPIGQTITENLTVYCHI
jgi:hypothetical protein